MYTGLLHLHDMLRWLFLLSSLVILVRYFTAWASDKRWKKSDNILGIIFTSIFDLQVLIGLILYFFYSPLTQIAFADFGAAMKNPDLRFFAVEHITLMLLALGLVHIGKAKSKKAKAEKAKFRIAATFYTLGLILVLAGIPWSKL